MIVISTIAENMFILMCKKNTDHVWMGDIHLIEECAKLSNIQKNHPQKVIQAVLNGLEKSELFEKGYLFTEYNGKKRKFRCFSIKSNTKKSRATS